MKWQWIYIPFVSNFSQKFNTVLYSSLEKFDGLPKWLLS